jgi:hypothetical protein
MSSSVEEALKARAGALHGRTINTEEAAQLKARLPSELLPASLLHWMLSYPLVEAEFYLSEDQDPTGLGVDMQWLTPAQMIDETLQTYPGILAGPAGYLPIGSCLVGSGDYYYLRAQTGEDPPLVRIPHDAVCANDRLSLDSIEVVSPRLSEFVCNAQTG